ncbi:Druantia anti-phage system protein DruA, partial [Thiocapsa sp.]|uniref:Druantia anti-phage system protein DruA n=1 Tax=Thiocapsa sp. TaxID=2024551 RepID=UPI002B8A6E51
MNEEPVGKLCGRALSAADLESIRTAVREADPPQRAEIARRVCTALNWVDVQGRPKLMSCRVGLLRLHRAGLIALPAPRNGNGNGLALQPRCEALPEAVRVRGSVQALAGLRLKAVATAADSRLWNALIARWHYLGYRPLSGAQLRYLIRWDGGVLGALGCGATSAPPWGCPDGRARSGTGRHRLGRSAIRIGARSAWWRPQDTTELDYTKKKD